MKMIDFHSHILPRADHGSGSEEMSRNQLDIIAGAGVSELVATPHFYAQRENVDSFLHRRKKSESLVCGYADELGIKMHFGAEVLICPGMEHMEGLEKLCIEGTNTLLIELPFAHWSSDLISTLYRLSMMDFRLVIAHIDRYLKVKNVWEVFEMPNLSYQLNATSLCGFFSRREVLPLIDDGLVCALGSDLHGTKGYRDFTKAVKIMGRERAEQIFKNTRLLLPS